MKLDYKILWLDDKIHEFIKDEYIVELEDYLIEEEFNPIIYTTDKQEIFYEKLKSEDYDLIMTDFHLNENIKHEEENGDEIVNKVRKEKIFTEILFYTAKADLKGSLNWDRISFLQTENQADEHHEEVIKKAKSLIELTIKKFHDIIVMRGMIMNETSSLDEQKQRLLKDFVQSKKYEDNIPQVRDRLFSEVNAFICEKHDKINKCIKNQNLNNLMKDDMLFSADKKISAMSEILTILSQKDFSSEYSTEIIKTRNKFAHASLIEEKGRKYFKQGTDGLTFDDNYCKEIRTNIRKHKKNLDDLEKIINK